ncbi:hypothetical protein MOBT1_002465 [Malassezia obtusa]|uniref:Uncharacterized protein n=1 Tax=Malassezia obtusa TaxID=76774 RepID=A0AAF0IX67_9BASI|nr:hypothetical protein MOBT1_002465 [Malassezia obtusa]
MAGHNLEVFRFGFYLAFPLVFMLYFGDPAWYDKHVLPVRRALTQIRDRFVPPDTGFRHPRTAEELREIRHSSDAQPSAASARPVTAELAAWRATDKDRLI